MRKVVGLSAMAGLLLVACLDEAADGAGRMLVEVGDKLADAGAALVDAGNSTADAQADAAVAPVPPGIATSETFEVDCVGKYAQIATRPSDGLRLTTTYHVAEIVTATGNITGVDAMVCGYQGPPPEAACLSNYTCTGSVPPQIGDCAPAAFVLDKGVVRVQCGSQVVTDPGAAGPSTFWKTARVTIRQK